MSDSPSATETLTATRALLHEAIWTLALAGIEVEIDGRPAHYVVDGKKMTEGDMIALASKIMPARSGMVQ